MRIGVRGVGVALAAICIAAPARAQDRPNLRTEVSSRRVEVGESFRVQLTAMSSPGAPTPSSPRLRAPPGVSMEGPRVSTQQQVIVANGRVEQRQGISATWTLTPKNAGRLRIGPASVKVAGDIVSDTVVIVDVVGKGQGGSRSGGFDPFDPFGNLPKFPRMPGLQLFTDEDEDPVTEEDLPPFPDELKTERALDPIAFLRATITPQSSVVGQQLTLRVYAYGQRGPFREGSVTEPSRKDFLSTVIQDNSYGDRMYRVPIDGQAWYALKVREIALFPIRSGNLEIGPMKMNFDGRGYSSSGPLQGLPRESPTLTAMVREPPEQGRPPGYQLGDVGQFSLRASVEPREITQNESVSVSVRLDGTGNLPYKLKPAQQHDVEWLEPNISEKVEPHGSVIGGYRTFNYVVRITRSGSVDLGELRLPYWDPSKESYEIARAALGTVRVKPDPKGASDEPVVQSPFEGMLAARKTLGRPALQPSYLGDTKWFWAALLLGPLGVLSAVGGLSASRKLRRRMSERQGSSQTLASQALKEAKRADDLAATASALERALFLAIEGATGLKARALLKDELAAELVSAGLSGSVAAEVCELLKRFDEIRFTGESAEDKSQLYRRTSEQVGALNKRAGTRSAA